MRSPSGQRHYTEAEVERVTFIQRLYGAGLSSKTIHAVLPCVHSPSEVNSDAALERLSLERDQLCAHIDDLVRTLATLDRVIQSAREHRGRVAADAA